MRLGGVEQEFLIPLNLATGVLAHEVGVEPRRIAEVIRGKRRISADTAIRLAGRFGNSAHFWLMLLASGWYMSGTTGAVDLGFEQLLLVPAAMGSVAASFPIFAASYALLAVAFLLMKETIREELIELLGDAESWPSTLSISGSATRGCELSIAAGSIAQGVAQRSAL